MNASSYRESVYKSPLTGFSGSKIAPVARPNNKGATDGPRLSELPLYIQNIKVEEVNRQFWQLYISNDFRRLGNIHLQIPLDKICRVGRFSRFLGYRLVLDSSLPEKFSGASPVLP